MSKEQERKLQRMRECFHFRFRKIVAGFVTDTFYRERKIIADECLDCGALFSSDLPSIKGVSRNSPPLVTVQ